MIHPCPDALCNGAITEADMDMETLLHILATIPAGEQVVIIGRKKAQISATIPDGPIPAGWKRVNEIDVQRRTGFQRIKYVG